MEDRVSKGNVVSGDIVVGSLFYFLKNVFDLYKFIMDILEGMAISTSAPNYGLSKAEAFLLGFFMPLLDV